MMYWKLRGIDRNPGNPKILFAYIDNSLPSGLLPSHTLTLATKLHSMNAVQVEMSALYASDASSLEPDIGGLNPNSNPQTHNLNQDGVKTGTGASTRASIGTITSKSKDTNTGASTSSPHNRTTQMKHLTHRKSFNEHTAGMEWSDVCYSIGTCVCLICMCICESLSHDHSN